MWVPAENPSIAIDTAVSRSDRTPCVLDSKINTSIVNQLADPTVSMLNVDEYKTAAFNSLVTRDRA
jgi:hypothetical protein